MRWKLTPDISDLYGYRKLAQSVVIDGGGTQFKYVVTRYRSLTTDCSESEYTYFIFITMANDCFRSMSELYESPTPITCFRSKSQDIHEILNICTQEIKIYLSNQMLKLYEVIIDE